MSDAPPVSNSRSAITLPTWPVSVRAPNSSSVFAALERDRMVHIPIPTRGSCVVSAESEVKDRPLMIATGSLLKDLARRVDSVIPVADASGNVSVYRELLASTSVLAGTSITDSVDRILIQQLERLVVVIDYCRLPVRETLWRRISELKIRFPLEHEYFTPVFHSIVNARPVSRAHLENLYSAICITLRDQPFLLDDALSFHETPATAIRVSSTPPLSPPPRPAVTAAARSGARAGVSRFKSVVKDNSDDSISEMEIEVDGLRTVIFAKRTLEKEWKPWHRAVPPQSGTSRQLQKSRRPFAKRRRSDSPTVPPGDGSPEALLSERYRTVMASMATMHRIDKQLFEEICKTVNLTPSDWMTEMTRWGESLFTHANSVMNLFDLLEIVHDNVDLAPLRLI
eukprot:TRINITY_DN2889_c0_g1_i1.p1 TRINITY_DN2889_c0_g1~~TRINITY_DN2889_c0_g1_i1.p1  ORF type:complete len:398 (-),score=55.08 TRINITY_DN2889_c0_g1_i1:1020-2213(-)